MVWGLLPVDPLSGEDKYYIFRTGIYKIGRKGCDVIITRDKGVSRVHAEIIVDVMNPLNPLPNESMSARVRIKDCSKYGTFISKNGGPRKKVHELPNKETMLEDGDLVSFGTGSATYRFCHIPFIFFICCSNEVDQSLEDKISLIGARITLTLGQDCTHVLVDQLMPLKKDLVDAVVAKKPCVLKTWLEFVAEKSIGTEIPGCNSYTPTVSAEGTTIKVADPKTRENCLKGYTLLLESAPLYKFGDQLKCLLEVGGAKVVSVDEFCSNSQGTTNGDDDRVVCVIPGGSTCNYDRFNKLSSLSRVSEMDVIVAALSGQLDPSKLISPCVLVSSSCSTDETVVEDSETEAETATSAHASDASNRDGIKHANAEMQLDDASSRLDKIKNERIEPSLDDASVRLDSIKYSRLETSLDYASPSLDGKRHTRLGTSLDVVSAGLDTHTTSFMQRSGSITVKKDKVDDSENGNLDIIYSQSLVVRDVDSNTPSTITTAPNRSVPNFKRFRKVQTNPGNSFDNLVPFSKYPYKDSDYENEEMDKSIKEEKKRKQMEAIAEDLFNNEKGRRRGTAGSLRGILIS